MTKLHNIKLVLFECISELERLQDLVDDDDVAIIEQILNRAHKLMEDLNDQTR